MPPKPAPYTALAIALSKLETDARYKRLSPKRKKLIARMAAVHVNPDNGEPDNVVKSMRRKRREQVKVATNAIAGVLESVGERGAAGVNALSDVEWMLLTGSE